MYFYCSLLFLICTLVVHRYFFIVLHWCLSLPPCYALFVFIGTSLLCLVGACQCVLVMLHWCSSTCPCYVLLVFVDASMLCFIVVHWHLLVTFPDLRGLMYFSTYCVHCCSLVLPCCTQCYCCSLVLPCCTQCYCCSLVLPCCTQCCCCSLVLSLVYFSNHTCSLSF